MRSHGGLRLGEPPRTTSVEADSIGSAMPSSTGETSVQTVVVVETCRDQCRIGVCLCKGAGRDIQPFVPSQDSKDLAVAAVAARPRAGMDPANSGQKMGLEIDAVQGKSTVRCLFSPRSNTFWLGGGGLGNGYARRETSCRPSRRWQSRERAGSPDSTQPERRESTHETCDQAVELCGSVTARHNQLTS